MDQKSIKDFDLLKSNLDEMKIPYKVNQNLVRGLDYYNDVVYEWKSEALGSQNTFCAGGRYDSLSKNLGGRDVSAAGFSIGLDRLIISLPNHERVKPKKRLIVIILENSLFQAGLKIAETLRNNVLKFLCHNLKVIVQDTLPSPFTWGFKPNTKLNIPIAHNDGNYYINENELKKLKFKGQIAFKYEEKFNPKMPSPFSFKKLARSSYHIPEFFGDIRQIFVLSNSKTVI